VNFLLRRHHTRIGLPNTIDLRINSATGRRSSLQEGPVSVYCRENTIRAGGDTEPLDHEAWFYLLSLAVIEADFWSISSMRAEAASLRVGTQVR